MQNLACNLTENKVAVTYQDPGSNNFTFRLFSQETGLLTWSNRRPLGWIIKVFLVNMSKNYMFWLVGTIVQCSWHLSLHYNLTLLRISTKAILSFSWLSFRTDIDYYHLRYKQYHQINLCKVFDTLETPRTSLRYILRGYYQYEERGTTMVNI